MKTVVFSGSFNPWHEGHTDVLNKALMLFDKVIVCFGVNPDKDVATNNEIPEEIGNNPRVYFLRHGGLMADFIKMLQTEAVYQHFNVVAMIRGIRNAQDLEYERVTQYYNEDFGVNIPTIYLIADRKHVHISSSAVRTIKRLRKK